MNIDGRPDSTYINVIGQVARAVGSNPRRRCVSKALSIHPFATSTGPSWQSRQMAGEAGTPDSRCEHVYLGLRLDEFAADHGLEGSLYPVSVFGSRAAVEDEAASLNRLNEAPRVP